MAISRLLPAALLFLGLSATVAAGQRPDTVPARRLTPLVVVGTELDDRLRTDHLTGAADPSDYLLRSTSSLTAAPDGTGLRWSAFAPEMRASWNRDLPLWADDGAFAAGRGWNVQLRSGFQLAHGGLRLVVAPEAIHSQNADLGEYLYPEFLDRQGGSLIPVWSSGRHSIDLPYRYGGEAITRLEPGQSTLAYETKVVAAGLSTEHQWWGPGLRNAIVLSNHAPGIPHAFVRTTAPLRTPVGSFSARWMLGRLAESEQFDSLSGNGQRSLSAVGATWQPPGRSGVEVGIARAVYALVAGAGEISARFADALVRWNQRYDPEEPSDSEQILSLFARWVLPEDGVEVYGEWARHELPAGPRDFLVSPEHSQGYTVGLQWARPVRTGSRLRLQGEITHLEQSATFRLRPTGSWYASRSIPQGYTHRGQVVGAAIGPGASSQWLAADYLAPLWRLGLFGGRIRWANDAYYDRERYLPGWVAHHDVSLFGGLRGSVGLAAMRVEGSWAVGKRYNYLFQSKGVNWDTRGNSISPITHTLGVAVTPR